MYINDNLITNDQSDEGSDNIQYEKDYFYNKNKYLEYKKNEYIKKKDKKNKKIKKIESLMKDIKKS